MSDEIPKIHYDLILARDAALRRAELAEREKEQAESDYAMLRAVARKCFQEESSEQDMLRLWNVAASVEHPGATLLAELARRDGWAKRWKRKAKGHRGNFHRMTRLWSALLLKKVKQDRELDAARSIVKTLRQHMHAGGEVWGSIDRDFAAYDAAVKERIK